MNVDGEEKTQDLLKDEDGGDFCYTKYLACRVDDKTVKRLKDEGATEKTIDQLLIYSRNSLDAAVLIQSHYRRWRIHRPYHRTRQALIQAVIVLQRWGGSRNPRHCAVITLQSIQRSCSAQMNIGYLRNGLCNLSHVLTIQTVVRRYLSLPIVRAENIARKATFQELTDGYDHTTKWRFNKYGEYTLGEETNEVVDMSTPRPCSYVKAVADSDDDSDD